MRCSLWIVGVLALSACDQTVAPPRAALGVFYGGQIQELRRVALSAEPGKERYGFQVALSGQATHVTWEIARPARFLAGKWVPAQAEVGEEELRTGEHTFSKIFSFEPGAPTGTWNFRVLVDRRLVLDRAIEVYDSSQKPRGSKNRG